MLIISYYIFFLETARLHIKKLKIPELIRRIAWTDKAISHTVFLTWIYGYLLFLSISSLWVFFLLKTYVKSCFVECLFTLCGQAWTVAIVDDSSVIIDLRFWWHRWQVTQAAYNQYCIQSLGGEWSTHSQTRKSYRMEKFGVCSGALRKESPKFIP